MQFTPLNQLEIVATMTGRPSVPETIHFVGSICLPDQRIATQHLCESLASRLRRISDGETGKRENFVVFQWEIFNESPFVQASFPPGSASRGPVISPGPDAPQIKLLPVEYDDFAISGYSEFCKLREEGIIPRGVRFQVSLPTPLNVLGNLITPSWRSTVEPLYEGALLAALRRIQDHIPPSDLAIQWDLASEFAYLEEAGEELPWFAPIKEGLLERVMKLAVAVDEGVELGFHLCYGDLGHKHFVEPKDTTLLCEVANGVLESVPRLIDWIHMPVPRSRVDAAYFAPLKNLTLGKTELYLGLLHANDEEGTRDRIKTAAEVIAPFGLATECGLGRSSQAELESILAIAKTVIGPKA